MVKYYRQCFMHKLFGIIFFVVIFSSCEKQNELFFPPKLGELKVSEITNSSVTVSCNVVETYELDVQECGFLYYPQEDSSDIHYVKANVQNTFSASICGLSPNTDYMVMVYAKNVAGIVYSESLPFRTVCYSKPTDFVNGYGYVDLGLPSGTLWAFCNVGSTTPEGYGNYYAWGEITTKKTYNIDTYRYYNGSMTKYNNSDRLTTLQPSDDAATANWGGDWRMPTIEEVNELKNNCTITMIMQNGVNGGLVTGTNGNSIFLPATGCLMSSDKFYAGTSGDYWSSSVTDYSLHSASILSLDFDIDCASHRSYGLSVRPVCQ